MRRYSRIKKTSDLCKHRAFKPGEDVWFRVFPAQKHGRRWKRGVILGVGEDIITAGGGMVGDQSDRGKTVIPSHHYTIWDSELQFITSRDKHHLRLAYSDRQRTKLLSWIDEIKPVSYTHLTLPTKRIV